MSTLLSAYITHVIILSPASSSRDSSLRHHRPIDLSTLSTSTGAHQRRSFQKLPRPPHCQGETSTLWIEYTVPQQAMYISSGTDPLTFTAYESTGTALQHHRAPTKTWTYDTTTRDFRVARSVYTGAPGFSSSYSATSFTAISSDIAIESGNTSVRSPSPRTDAASVAQPYECPQLDCSRKFGRRYSLAEHVKTHSGEKSHVCPAMGCRKRFSTSGNLSRHKRLHGYIEPLQCPVEGCQSSFPSNNKLEKHMQYHLGSPVHVCKIGACGKTFSTMGNLNRHVRHHHGSEPVESDSGRSSFASTTSSSRRRSSSAPSYQHQPLQSPTTADSLYSSSRERALSQEQQAADPSSHSAPVFTPFPRTYSATVTTLGDPERVWSHDTILDSLASIFNEETASHASGAQLPPPLQEQQHVRPHAQHHGDGRAYDNHLQQPHYTSTPSDSDLVAAAVTEAGPADARLLDDMIHFHVANFQC